MNFWDRFWQAAGVLAAVLTIVIILALVALGAHAVYNGYARHQKESQARSQTKIEREHLERNAIKRYEDQP